jgi:hypothetical protein
LNNATVIDVASAKKGEEGEVLHNAAITDVTSAKDEMGCGAVQVALACEGPLHFALPHQLR